MQPLECLRRYPLFNLLTSRQIETWLQGGEELPFTAGETIFQEGATGIWVYLVLDGRVRIVRRSPSGRELSLGMLGFGEVFGEYALVPPHRHTATCRAAGAVRLLRLPLLPLRRLLASWPKVTAQLKNWLRLHGLLGYLREQAFLGFMSAPSALRFLDYLEPAIFRALRTIQADGLGSDRWYFLQEGQVWLHPPAQGPEQPPRELGPGDCFGELALLGQENLPVVVAGTRVRCLCLPRTAFASPPKWLLEASYQSLEPHLSTVRKVYPWVGQREEADCGVAALAMIAHFHGLNVPVESLRQRVTLGEHGATLLELQRVARTLGLRSLAIQAEASQFNQLQLPTLAHFKSGHYVVLYELTPEGAVIGDPASGIVRQSRRLFEEQCSGRLLLVGTRSATR